MNGQFDAGGGMRFSQLADLVDYYKKNPMIEKAGGNVVHLKAVSTTLSHRHTTATLTLYLRVDRYQAFSAP